MTATKTLTTELVKSRHYDPVNWQMWYASPMVDLVAELEAECASRGLTLSRWQTNRGSKAVSITYAIHKGERAHQFRYQPDATVVDYCHLTSLEGVRTRCNAYRELSKLLADLRADPR